MTATATKRSRASGVRPKPPEDQRRRTRGFHVIEWIETHCVHTNGQWIGLPFRLLGWQKQLILELFELEWFPAHNRWLRRYRWALIGMAKKNGKTELAAALALYLLIGDEEPAPLIICAAASDEQADLVFGACSVMCTMSPTLAAVTEVWEREITVPSIPGARLKRVAAVAGTNDGRNIQATICDELHEWVGDKGERTHDVLTNGSGNRLQPLVLQITTAGFDKETVLGKHYDLCKRIEAGEIEDRRYFFRWWELDPGDDYRDPTKWHKAHPSLGTLVQPDYLADQLTKKTEAVWRRYFGNQWTESEEAWLPTGVWERLADPKAKLDPHLPIYVAIDVGLTHDSSAVAIAQRRLWRRPGERKGRMRTLLKVRIWENPYDPKHHLYSSWKLNLGDVEAYLIELRKRYPEPATQIDDVTMPGPEYDYDEMFFERSAQDLAERGLAMVEVPQTDSRMIPASQDFYTLAVNDEIVHDGDPALARHVAGAIAHQKPRGWRLSKPRGSRRHIDGCVASAIAAHAAQREPPPPPRRRRFRSF